MQLPLDPKMRSPSQWPGTARSSTSAGRSEMSTISGIRLVRLMARRAWGRRIARPLRRAWWSSASQRSPSLHVEGLVDRLVRHRRSGSMGYVLANHSEIWRGEKRFSKSRSTSRASLGHVLSLAGFGRRPRRQARRSARRAR